MRINNNTAIKYPETEIPIFWPSAFFLGMRTMKIETLRKRIKLVNEVKKTQIDRPAPQWATKNKVILDLHTMSLRDFSTKKERINTLIVAPYAGHTSIIADFSTRQSLVKTLIENGVTTLFVTEWKGATQETKHYDIDNYLCELNLCIDDLGGAVNLIGLCQGGWLSAMYAARFPNKVNTLVLAGAPIDTNVGEAKINDYAHTFPMEFYKKLVAVGGGILKGEIMLKGFKSLNPEKQYLKKIAKLYENIDNAEYIEKFEEFERWYEYTIDLPGTWYLQVVKEIFKENRLFKGKFIGLGKEINLKEINCPAYLLAGEGDDITPKEQVFNAEKRLGTDKSKIVKDLASGGHIGLFMGQNH